MIALTLVGIGTGNPQHLTLQAIDALNAADVILIPRKGPGKDDLAGLRREICKRVLRSPGPRLHEFDLPVRDVKNPDYQGGVDDWHDAIASVWDAEIRAALPDGGNIAFLVWGDPSLYDSTMRIAERVRARMTLSVTVIPGITAIQALTAGHAIPLNEVAAPFVVTTGRRLRKNGWPKDADTVVVMLDGNCAFESLAPEGISIWWSAYAGMGNEIRIAGPLAQVAEDIVSTRSQARSMHGWIMDTYLMRRAHESKSEA
jgi:precorrin-6A synthase